MSASKLRRAARLAFIPLLLLAAWGSYTQGAWRFVTPDAARYPIRGVDVSHHQGTIDWQTLATQSGVRFAFIKATEGGDYRDPQFPTNWQQATQAGLSAAPYHFFTFCRGGAEQAANFLETTRNISATLPPVVDLEYVGNCKTRPESAEFERELSIFLQQIENHFGSKAVFYTTREFEEDYLTSALWQQNPRWLRSVFTQPASHEPWIFWQYADHARLPGIKGPVDLNVFHGSAEDWKKYLLPESGKAR